MKKIRLIAIVTLLLAAGMPNAGKAKPAYCYDALGRCQQGCNSYYMSDACKAGCGIGYLMCAW